MKRKFKAGDWITAKNGQNNTIYVIEGHSWRTWYRVHNVDNPNLKLELCSRYFNKVDNALTDDMLWE